MCAGDAANDSRRQKRANEKAGKAASTEAEADSQDADGRIVRRRRANKVSQDMQVRSLPVSKRQFD